VLPTLTDIASRRYHAMRDISKRRTNRQLSTASGSQLEALLNYFPYSSADGLAG